MPEIKLDATDIKILGHLQENAKLSNVELAGQVHLSPSPCLSRVRRLEDSGIISRYVTLLEPQKLGLNVSVFIQITLERQAKVELDQFESSICNYPEVMECYLMTGESDYLVRILVPDVQALEYFIINKLTQIPGISNIRSSVALKQVKYETALPLSQRN